MDTYEHALSTANKALEAGLKAASAGDLALALASKRRAFNALAVVPHAAQQGRSFDGTWGALGILEIAINQAKIEQEQALTPIALLARKGWVTRGMIEKRRTDGLWRVLYRCPFEVDRMRGVIMARDLTPYYELERGPRVRNAATGDPDAPLGTGSNFLMIWLSFVPEHAR